MKKKLLSISAMLLTACMISMLAACNHNAPDEPGDDDDDIVNVTPPDEGEEEAEPSVNPSVESDETLRKEIAQMIVTSFPGTSLTTDSYIYRDLNRYGLGGVILFEWRGNIASPQQLRTLCSDLKRAARGKLLIAIDQEGGKVTRLRPKYGFPDFPSAEFLGQADDAVTSQWAETCASTLADAGINTNYAPVVDVNVNPKSPSVGAIQRSFSDDPLTVARKAQIWIRAHTDKGVVSCAKHFPGHGSAVGDSHKGTTDVTNTWTEDELIPYRELIEAGDLDMVMVGHLFNSNLDPEHPASLSKKVVDGLLRDKLKFQGVVVTDDLGMGALVNNYGTEQILELAINAGVDMLCMSGDATDTELVPRTIDIIFNKVKSGAISPDRIHQAAARIAALKEKF